jgi:NADPH:quinone reductase-like Zn-dependent oxidoreductase
VNVVDEPAIRGQGKHHASKEIQLPAIAGFDGVARLADGRRVYTGAVAPYGMMAERTLVNPHGAVELPEHVDSVTAAAVPNPGMSAWMSLEHAAAVQPGDNVLVLGATGVTCSMAVQLARTVFGAGRVVVAGRNISRLDWLRTVGADDAIALDESHSRCWHDCAPKRCRDCSRWSLPANCNYIQRHVRSPTSARSGPRPSPRAPEWC